MNDQYKIDWEARIQGFNQEFDDNNSYSRRPNPGNMEIWVQQQQQDINHHHHHQQQSTSFVRNKPSSTTIMSRFETPASAFYATERCMGFQNYGKNFSTTNYNDENSNLGLSSHFYNSSSFMTDSSFDHQIRPNHNNDPFVTHDNVIPCVTRHFSLNRKEDHCIGGSSSYGGCFSEMSFDSCNQNHNQNHNHNHNHNHKQQSLKLASGNGPVTKTRIRWTQELHEKFVECLNRLGGAEKATPKGILRLMESEGLTIFHVKSHLQKYRIAKYLPDSAEGKYEKRASGDVNPQLEATTTGQQIKEALHLQLDVQRRLHEQLEIQRKLQLQIEEQGKQLKMMFDMQQRRSSQGSDISTLDEEATCSDINDELEVSIHVPSKIS